METKSRVPSQAVPYIGVTGLTSRQEVEAAMACIPPKTEKKLMVGVMVSSFKRGNARTRRYPDIKAIKDIFIRDPRVLNLIYYYAPTDEGLSDRMAELVDVAGDALDGFRLNFDWPSDRHLFDFQQKFGRKYHIVLRIDFMLMRKYLDDPLALVSKLSGKYLGFINTVSMDRFRAPNDPLEPALIDRQVRILSEHLSFGIELTGAIGPESLKDVRPFMQEHPWLSINAEGHIRHPGIDTLDVDGMQDYLTRAFRVV